MPASPSRSMRAARSSEAARNAARSIPYGRSPMGDAAGDAAWDPARDALRPVVVILQESAIALYDQMIKGTWE